jgi:hypothetical protein
MSLLGQTKAPTNKGLGATQMAGARVFQAEQNLELDKPGLMDICNFLK